MSKIHCSRGRPKRQGHLLAETLTILAMLALGMLLVVPGFRGDPHAVIASIGWLFATVALVCVVGVYIAAQKYFAGRHRVVSMMLGLLVAAVAYHVGTSASAVGIGSLLAVAFAGCVVLGVRSMRRVEQ